MFTDAWRYMLCSLIDGEAPRATNIPFIIQVFVWIRKLMNYYELQMDGRGISMKNQQGSGCPLAHISSQWAMI